MAHNVVRFHKKDIKMKAILALAFGLVFSLTASAYNITSTTVKSNEIYAFENVGSGSPNPLPNIKIETFTGGTVEVTPRDFTNPSSPRSIVSMTLKFQDMPEITATNFKQDGDFFFAVIDDQWMFSKMVVSIHLPPFAIDNTPGDVALYALNSGTQLTNLESIYNEFRIGEMFFTMNDVTPTYTTDTLTSTLEGKKITYELQDRISSKNGHGAFNIIANWEGHGKKHLEIESSALYEDLVGTATAIRLSVDSYSNDLIVGYKRDEHSPIEEVIIPMFMITDAFMYP